jgi:hypothetical protein
MTEGEAHKFHSKLETTYYDHQKTRYEGMVEMAREMEKELGKEKALEIVGRVCDRMAVASVERMMEGREPIRDMGDFISLYREMMELPYYKHAVTCTFEEESEDGLLVRITECLSAKVFKDMDATDIGYVMCCRPDHAVAKAYSPNIKFKRTKTLMEGDEECDLGWGWEE